MTEEFINTIAQDAFMVSLLVGAPALVAGLAIGLSISLVQALTQINEMTLVFIPKILGIFIALMIFGPWMLRTMLDFTQRMFAQASMVGF